MGVWLTGIAFRFVGNRTMLRGGGLGWCPPVRSGLSRWDLVATPGTAPSQGAVQTDAPSDLFS